MTIDLVEQPHRYINLYPGNEHTTHPDRPSRVVGAYMMRIALTIIVGPEPSEVRADLEEGLLPEHRHAGPYGLAMLESQEISAMMLTTAEQIKQFRAETLRLTPGLPTYSQWPNSPAWEDLIPNSTWHPGGVGVLGEFDNVLGGKVTAYEFTVDRAQAWNRNAEPSGENMTMVSYHCDRCHTPDWADMGERWENRCPDDRRWAGQKARLHALGMGKKCEVPNGRMEPVVAAVASEMQGREVRLAPRDAWCAMNDACSQVRLARATTTQLTTV